MEIVIENPGEIGSRSHGVPSAEYFASLANQRLLTGAEVDGNSSLRRVDRSGLLEMPQIQHTETIPRRIDRSGLLESVSEIPGHIPYSKSSRLLDTGGIPIGEERHLTGAEIVHEEGPSSLTLPRFRCRERRGSHESSTQTLDVKKESKEPGGCFGTSRSSMEKGGNGLNHVEQMIARFSPSRTPTPTESGVDRLKTKTEGIGRLSPRSRNDHRVSSPAALSIPDVIEAHEPPGNNNPTSRNNGNDDSAPEGERAEAEGCEHTAIESLEETRVSFKGSKKIMHNENIQTLRVIILSEQL